MSILEKRGVIPLATGLLVVGMTAEQSLGWPSLAAKGLLVLSCALLIGGILARKRSWDRL